MGKPIHSKRWQHYYPPAERFSLLRCHPCLLLQVVIYSIIYWFLFRAWFEYSAQYIFNALRTHILIKTHEKIQTTETRLLRHTETTVGQLFPHGQASTTHFLLPLECHVHVLLLVCRESAFPSLV